jgi:hypothetical protein
MVWALACLVDRFELRFTGATKPHAELVVRSVNRLRLSPEKWSSRNDLSEDCVAITVFNDQDSVKNSPKCGRT